MPSDNETGKFNGYDVSGYDAVEPFRGSTTIQHHFAIETAEEAVANGRTFYPLVGNNS